MVGIENNLPLRVIFATVFSLLVLERITNTFARKNPARKAIKVFHKQFFYLLLAVYLAIVLLSCVSFLRLNQINGIVSLLGAVILGLGIALRRAAIRRLADYWSPFIEIKQDQHLIREGIYKYLRHPYYLAVVLELIGFSLFCNAYWALTLTLLVQVPLLLTRAHYENRILDVFGRRLGFRR